MATGNSTNRASGASGQRNLQFGMHGEDVKEWQRQLIRDGQDLSPCLDDGKFGTLTKRATMAWQAAHGLAASGIVDAVTRAAVGSAKPGRAARWTPPAPPEDGLAMVVALDPDVVQSHRAGELPCPANPPPPDGWAYYRNGPIPEGGGELASKLAFSSAEYPLGTFVQTFLDGRLFGARVEWHDTKGATGEKGCFRGASLMVPTAGRRTSRPSFGVDSLRPVGAKSGAKTLAELAVNDLGGQVPLFWGRYVSKPGGSDYKPGDEAATLKSLGIRVLPIARQTGHVGGTAALGKADAKNNILALKEVFGSDTLKARKEAIYLFLDVEAETPLSREYYTAWAEEIANADVMVGPCLYMPNYANHPASWRALQGALASGAACEGLWIAWYLRESGSSFLVPPSWDPRRMANPTQIPVLAWQYLGDVHEHALDYSLVNPTIDLDSELLAHLILPA